MNEEFTGAMPSRDNEGIIFQTEGEGLEGEEDEEDEEEEEEEEEDTNVGQRNPNTSSNIYTATPTLGSLSDPDDIYNVREIGHEAVWSLSTAKPGNGVAQIRDSNPNTYWQSDGPQPHLINIHFQRRKAICEVAFYLDFSLDESYTPKSIGIKAGITHHDLEQIKVIELNEPIGWVSLPLYAVPDPLDDVTSHDHFEGMDGKDKMKENEKNRSKPLRTFFLQISILSMHQNGRDTHVRQVKIFGPRETSHYYAIRSPSSKHQRFNTVELSQFSSLR